MWNRTASYTRIKLCWFEHLEAAYEAAQTGADALGFHILQGDKEDWRAKARRLGGLISVLPKSIESVLLVDHPFEVLAEILALAPFDCVQLYPDWDPEVIRRLKSSRPAPIRVMKVMSAQLHENVPVDVSDFIAKYSDAADAILLDSCRQGGSGQLADLATCSAIVQECHLPVFLAGGLNAGNVANAIRLVRPFGVDVETGVSENVKGVGLLKSVRRCQDFVDAVIRVDRELVRERASR